MKLPTTPTLFTIGHSLHNKERFLSLLTRHDIRQILDIRSSPTSKRAPHFSRSELPEWLDHAGIAYSFAGRHLGGRPSEPDLYEGGRVSYTRMAVWPMFVAGLRKTISGAKRVRLALMCSERDPIDCHRFLLVGRYLKAHNIPVLHILGDGALESQDNAELRLMASLGVVQSDLFVASTELVSAAYAIQSARRAYHLSGARPSVAKNG